MSLLPRPWRGAALARLRPPHNISFRRSVCTRRVFNRRLPRMTHGVATLLDVRGSRLFSHVSAGPTLRRRLRGWPETLQSGSPPGDTGVIRRPAGPNFRGGRIGRHQPNSTGTGMAHDSKASAQARRRISSTVSVTLRAELSSHIPTSHIDSRIARSSIGPQG